MKKVLDKSNQKRYNIQAVTQTAAANRPQKNISKEVEKTFKKVLTKGNGCGIITRSPRRGGADL